MGGGCDRVDGLGRGKKKVAELSVKKRGQNRLIIF